ncbi:hypothetical protein [Luteimonas suaedae]|uniref:hypothetical protein n=1 Tax=Luteimonas suaedae TaxID=2605430 RepID=UPI0011EF2186|nr:hypothetical protein [Luteimonas suaedae]
MSARASTAVIALSTLLLGACDAKPPAAGTAADPVVASATFAERVAGAAAAANPLSDPRADVMAAIERMQAAASYAVDIETAAGNLMLEHVAPDRFRMTMPNGITQTILGDRMYMQMQGQSTQVPLQAGMLEKFRDRGRIAAGQQGTTIEPLGADSVAGKPARKYRMVHEDPDNPPAILWIGSDGYPLQMQVVADAQATTTARYSRFNDASIRIEAPE